MGHNIMHTKKYTRFVCTFVYALYRGQYDIIIDNCNCNTSLTPNQQKDDNANILYVRSLVIPTRRLSHIIQILQHISYSMMGDTFQTVLQNKFMSLCGNK